MVSTQLPATETCNALRSAGRLGKGGLHGSHNRNLTLFMRRLSGNKVCKAKHNVFNSHGPHNGVVTEVWNSFTVHILGMF